MSRHLTAGLLAIGSPWLTSLALAQAPSSPPEEAQEVEVLVQGERTPTGERVDPTPATYTLTGDALSMPGRSTADTLATAAGVQVTRRGGVADLATLSLRGSSNAQAPIYLAGVRLNDELTGSVDLSLLPLWMMHRVEVYRGHAPTSVDELGMGGAVLLTPRLPSGDRAVQARAGLGFGSFGQRSGRAALGVGDSRGGAVFSIAHHTARDDYAFVDDGGTRFDDTDDVIRRRDNADHRDTDVWAVAHYRAAPVGMSMVVSGFDREAGAPGLQLNGAENARARRRRWLGGVSLTVGAPDDPWTLQTDVGALFTRYRLLDPRSELGFAREVENRGTRHNERLRLTWRPARRLAMTLGGSHESGRLHLDSDGRALDRASRVRLRPAFALLSEPVDDLHLSGVAALTSHETRATGVERRLLVPAARVGARYRVLPELAILANAGRYARVPTLGELYGVAAAVRGNAELEPEWGWTFDLGASTEMTGRRIAAYAQLVGFARLASALIGYRRSSLGVIRPYNIAEARILGVEAAAGVTLWRTAVLSTTVSATDPRDVSDDRATTSDLVPLQSRLVVSPRLELRSPAWNALSLDRASLGATLAYRSSRIADPAGLIVLDEQARFDLDLRLAFAKRITLVGRMQNVFDTQVFDVVGYPLPGRALYSDLEVAL